MAAETLCQAVSTTEPESLRKPANATPDPATPGLPEFRSLRAAAFLNPYRNGQCELVLGLPDAESNGIGTQIHRLMRGAPNNEWCHQAVVRTQTDLTHLLTASYRESVRAYWCDQSGTVWESRLTPSGFAAPTAFEWSKGTKMLRVTYYVPGGAAPAEPVLYGVTRSHLWIKTIHDACQRVSLPASMSSDVKLTLSMTGQRSWVIDTVQGGYLRRWNSRAGANFEGPVVYRMAGVDAVRVFGTCTPPHIRLPQPLFVASDGLVYLWNSRKGPVHCTTAGEDVLYAQAGTCLASDSLVYTANRHGNIVVTRQMATDGDDPRWGDHRVISRTFRPHAESLVPLLEPHSVPALFIISDSELTLLSASTDIGTAPAALESMEWVSEKTALNRILERSHSAAPKSDWQQF